MHDAGHAVDANFPSMHFKTRAEPWQNAAPSSGAGHISPDFAAVQSHFQLWALRQSPGHAYSTHFPDSQKAISAEEMHSGCVPT